MPPNSKPTIVLVHGAWYVPEHYVDFTRRLRQSGFEVFCPLLPTCDEAKRENANLAADVETVHSLITSLVDKSLEVVLLLHSYGGAVGTDAAQYLSITERNKRGLAGGVKHLIYMCGFMLQVGESVGGASLPRPVPEPVEFDAATGTTFLCESPTQLFYADVEPKLAKKMENLLVRQSKSAQTDTISYAAWRRIPTTYLIAQHDQVLFLDWQERQIKAVRNAGVEIVVERYDSSHSPFLSMPGSMVAAVERAAKR